MSDKRKLKFSFGQGKQHSRNNRNNRSLFYLISTCLALSVASLALFISLSGFAVSQLFLESFITSYSTIVFSIFFSLLAFFYILYKTNSIEFAVKNLGLNRKMITPKNILIGLSLFVIMLIVEFGISAFSQVTHIALPTNVQQVLSGLPIYFFVFTFLIAPINEEIFFRGFLVNRIGIIPSALLFALLHFGYASISEFVAALIFGFVAGYVFKKTGSLYTTIIAHILLNMLTIVALFLI